MAKNLQLLDDPGAEQIVMIYLYSGKDFEKNIIAGTSPFFYYITPVNIPNPTY